MYGEGLTFWHCRSEALFEFLQQWRASYLAFGIKWKADQGCMMNAILRLSMREHEDGGKYQDDCGEGNPEDVTTTQRNDCAARWVEKIPKAAERGAFAFKQFCFFDQSQQKQRHVIGNVHVDCSAPGVFGGCKYLKGDFLQNSKNNNCPSGGNLLNK